MKIFHKPRKHIKVRQYQPTTLHLIQLVFSWLANKGRSLYAAGWDTIKGRIQDFC